MDDGRRTADDGRPVLAIDPGRGKCGIAIVDSTLTVVYRGVVLTGELEASLRELCVRFDPAAVIIGNGTGSARVIDLIRSLSLTCPVEVVEESRTSEAARARYVAEVPARGWQRLIPRSLRTPAEAYDDFVAVILAERWWRARVAQEPQ